MRQAGPKRLSTIYGEAYLNRIRDRLDHPFSSFGGRKQGFKSLYGNFFASKQGFKKNVRVAFEKRTFIGKNKTPHGRRELPIGGYNPECVSEGFYYEYDPKHDPAP